MVLPASFAWATPAFSLNFNGPDRSWQLMPGGAPAQILAQEIIPGGAHDQNGLERIVVVGAAGQSALLVVPIPQMAVLDELQVRLWVNGTRPDLQLGVRVVLPRSRDANGRSPVVTIVRGSVSNKVGHWQELTISEVPKLLAAQVRVMRAAPGAAIDSHEAYADGVVLIVPGDPNGVELGTDDLTVDGVPLPGMPGQSKRPQARTVAATLKNAPPPAQTYARTNGQAAFAQGGSSAASSEAAAKPNIRLQGTSLYVDGRPFLPRVVQWNGEKLAFLANCGFNVVQLTSAPSEEQSQEASRAGVWFLCPPEHPDALAKGTLGRPNDRVLAWHLHDDAMEVDGNYAMRWAELVRDRDAVFGRPVIITPQSNWSAVNRSADILVAQNARTERLTRQEFEWWFGACPRLAQPGTPLWVWLPTEMDESVRRQVGALTRTAAPPLGLDIEQLNAFVEIACAEGARGFVFQSASSLSETDESTRQRVATLQLVNHRLQLMEPWLAGGKMVEKVYSSDGNQAAILLHVDRAGLLVPVPGENRATKNPVNIKAKPRAKEFTFTVPGLSETNQVFYLSPVAMRSVDSQRVAGGMRMTMPAAEDGFLLITEDSTVIGVLRQRVMRDGPKVVQLERDLSAQRARTLALAAPRLVPLGYSQEIAAQDAAVISQQRAQIDAYLSAGQIEPAHAVAAGLLKHIGESAEQQRRVTATNYWFESNPLSLSNNTLLQFAELQQALGGMRPGTNLLVGGDFEDLGQMTQQGWQHLEQPLPDVRSSAQLSGIEPQHGRYCLELSANLGSPSARPATVANSVSIVSPPVSVSANQLIEISGWVRVDRQFAPGDFFEIADSLGGPALAIRVEQTSGWQPFRMIREAADESRLSVTFSLSGIGSAKVDGVMIQTLQPPVAQRLPPTGPGGGLSTATSPAATGEPQLLAAPVR